MLVLLRAAVVVLLLIPTAALADHSASAILAGGADPTGVATTGPEGEIIYVVATTGEGTKILQSTDLKNWEVIGRAFDEPVPQWAKEAVPGTAGIWAPDLSYHDGLYYLYYSCSTFGGQRSVMGLAVNKSLNPDSDDYKWVDRGLVMESTPGKDNFNAIDPALLVDQDGKWWLFWGSFWTGIKYIELDPETGKPLEGAETKPVAARASSTEGEGPAWSQAIEAPFVYYHDGYYYLFVSWDACCEGADSTYKVTVGRSKSPTGPYLDQAGKPMLDGGGTIVLQSDQRWRGTGHCSVMRSSEGEFLLHHTYDMQNLDAQRILQVRPLTWSDDGWPEVGEPILAEE